MIEGLSNRSEFYNTEIKGLYYLRDDDPLDMVDVGSLMMGTPIENETTQCGLAVNFHFAQIGIYTGEIRILNPIIQVLLT